MSLVRQTYIDSVKYLLSRIVPALVGYVSIILYIRLIGVEEYGKFSFLNSFAMMVSSLSVSWINQSVLKFYHQDGLKSGFYKFIFIGLGVSLAFQLLLITTSVYFDIVLLDLKWAIILSTSISIYLFIRAQLQIRFKTKQTLYFEAAKNIFSLALSLLLIFYFHKTEYQVIIYGVVASIVLFSILSFGHINITSTSNNKINGLQKYLAFGLPIGLWLFIIQAFGYYDRYLVNKWLSPTELGIFSSISDLSAKLFSFILFPIVLAIHPIMAKNWESNQNELKEVYSKIYKSLIFAFLMIVLLSFLLKNIFFEIITGIEYNGEYFIVFIIVSQFLWTAVLLLQKPLELNNKSNYLVIALIFVVAIHIFLTQTYTPTYGLLAQSVSYAVSGFIYILIVLILNRFTK